MKTLNVEQNFTEDFSNVPFQNYSSLGGKHVGMSKSLHDFDFRLHLLAASINLLYNSKVITGIGSMRKYCFSVPQMMFISSYTPKFMESSSGTKQIKHEIRFVYNLSKKKNQTKNK